jgi:small nuclear ribonucleoprotein (snRNP)-like protein
MNIVLDDTTEVYTLDECSNVKSKATKQIGKIMLKGENVTLVRTMTYNNRLRRDITM